VKKAGFPVLLRRMTLAGKEAHRELVVAEFEKALDSQYVALSGKRLADYGIILASRGEQQSVTVDTQIGQNHIKRVLRARQEITWTSLQLRDTIFAAALY